MKKIFAQFLVCALIGSMALVRVDAGYISGAASAAGCASVVVACYSAAGAVFGTIAAESAPSAILASYAAFGKCLETTDAVYSCPFLP